MLQKNTFGQKKILNSMHKFKSANLPEMKNCQNGTFKPVHEIQIFFDRKTSFGVFWRWDLQKIFLTCPRVRLIQDLGQSA